MRVGKFSCQVEGIQNSPYLDAAVKLLLLEDKAQPYFCLDNNRQYILIQGGKQSDNPTHSPQGVPGQSA